MLNRFYDALRVQEAEQRYLACKAYPRLEMIKIGIIITGGINLAFQLVISFPSRLCAAPPQSVPSSLIAPDSKSQAVK